MASLTFSTPNGLNYGTGDVTINLDELNGSFTVSNILIDENNSWTFDVQEYYTDNHPFIPQGLTEDTHLNGSYTFNFDNGCTSVHQINVPQFTEEPCPDNCKEYQVENNHEETVFYYSDCETGEVQEITMYQGDTGIFCICDGEYYDPSGKLSIVERGSCLPDFNCDITNAYLTGQAIEGQYVIDNVTITNEGTENPILITSVNPPQFEAGFNSYDINYVIPSEFGNSGETCVVRIQVSVTTTTTTTPPPPSDCSCVKVEVTYVGELSSVRYSYDDCEGNRMSDTIRPGDVHEVCMCELETPRVPKLIYEQIGLCDPNGPGDGFY